MRPLANGTRCVHPSSFYWETCVNKVTLNSGTDRRKWSDSRSDPLCSSSHRYPRQEVGGPQNRICHGDGGKIAVIVDNQSPAYQHSALSLHKYVCSHTHHLVTYVFTQTRKTNATTDVKPKLLRTHYWISTAIMRLKNREADHCLVQSVTTRRFHDDTAYVTSKSRWPWWGMKAECPIWRHYSAICLITLINLTTSSSLRMSYGAEGAAWQWLIFWKDMEARGSGLF
jgi:hypothetical protein